MTTVLEFLGQLRAMDVNISLDGEALKISAPKGVLTAELRQELSSRKPEIIQFLRSSREAVRAGGAAISPMNRGTSEPLSFAQQRLWFLNQLDGGGPVYNIPAALRLSGQLDVSALEAAMTSMISRHEDLRTRFVLEDGAPRCIIDAESSWHLERVDLRHLAQHERERAALQYAVEFSRRTFDLAAGPLIRSALVSLDQETHLLVVCMHHIISDGWSIGIFVRELVEVYSAARNGARPVLPALSIQYADFAQWQRRWLGSGELARQLPYWKEQLAGAPPVVTFPPDYRRPDVEKTGGRRALVVIPRDLVAQLEQLSRDNGVTLFMLLLAAFKTLLFRYSGQEDVVVGIPSANRSRSELHPLIGFFVNNLVLRTSLADNPTFTELLARVREVTLRAYDHQDVPFDTLVHELHTERSVGHAPLFQTMFSFQNFPLEDLELPGLRITPVDMEVGIARYDLCVEMYPRHGELRTYFEYNTDLYHPDTIAAMQEHLLTLLKEVLADPSRTIDSIPLLSEAEQYDLIVLRNQTGRPVPAGICFHHRFEQIARDYPERFAVTTTDSALTYAQLNSQANQIAQALARRNVEQGSIVAICMERGTELLAGLLGILKTGAAYLPLDPIYPRMRIASILEDAKPVAVLTTESMREVVSQSACPLLTMDTLRLEYGQQAPDPVVPITQNDIAYVIFTSGSTGKPKGVQIPHHALVNFLESMAREPGLGRDDVLLAVTTVSFDIAALELFLPLYVGGRVHIATRPADPDALLEELTTVRPNVMQATPATWQLLLSSGWQGDTQLKILCGGEALDVSLARSLLARCASLWNMYGPTETTIWSSALRVGEPLESSVPLGPPIANTAFYILDGKQQLMPVGAVGELYIGGNGIALGYLRRPELTSERFLRDPFSASPQARMYRTGDLARYRRDGSIEFLGRVDHQVKLRGFRIELGEIEHALRAQSGVKDAVVVVREQDGDKTIVGYVVADGSVDLIQSTLREALRESLPAYMVPAFIVSLKEFPRMPNGKLNRIALPAPERVATASQCVEPSNEDQRAVAEVFKDILNVERVSIYDNFFELGAHSLLIVKAHSRLKGDRYSDLQLVDFFRYPTIEQLAAQLTTRNLRKTQETVESH
jgi:amino acid adenylation domain-containing protein